MAPMEKNPTVENIKCVISGAALIFSIALITGLQLSGQTTLAKNVHPILAIVLLWGTTSWLTFIEGSQASLVILAPVRDKLYKESHPIAYKCAEIALHGDHLDRYLLGRQFMVVFVVFTINVSGGPIGGATLWGLPEIIINIFMGSGLCMILFTTMCGQLHSQVNASHKALDYLNNNINYLTIAFARCVEFSGLVHSSYVIQILIMAMAGKDMESNEPPKTPLQNLFFFTRCIYSVAILIFAFAVTLTALFQGKTTMWAGVPPGLSVVVFFFLMGIVGMLEGMQIAFFYVAKLRPEDRGDNAIAKAVCGILYHGNSYNLSGFMIGRQLSVVSCMFFIARCTSLNIDPYGGETLWGVQPSTQKFFNFGFLGALITTVVASIAWQLIASCFPIAFLSNPLTYVLLRIALFLEGTGICNGTYIIAKIYSHVLNLQLDEIYIGTAEERAANINSADDWSHLHMGAGHLVKLPGFVQMLDSAPPQLRHLAKTDTSVFSYLAETVKHGGNGQATDRTEFELTENDNKSISEEINV